MPHVLVNSAGLPIRNNGKVVYSNKFNNVVKLEGNDHIIIPYHAGINFGLQSNFSIATWVLPVTGSVEATPRFFLYSKRKTGTPLKGHEFYLVNNSGVWYVAFIMWVTVSQSNLVYAALPGFTLSQWAHFVIVKNNANYLTSVASSEWKLYYNGAELVTSSLDTIPSFADATNTFAAYINNTTDVTGTGDMYQGPMAVYNGAMGLSDVQHLYKMDGKLSKTVADALIWGTDVKENSGTTITNKVGGNDASLVNAANTTAGNPANAYRNGKTLLAA